DLYDLAEKRVVRTFPLDPLTSLDGYPQFMNSKLAWSSDGKFLTYRTSKEQKFVKLDEAEKDPKLPIEAPRKYTVKPDKVHTLIVDSGGETVGRLVCHSDLIAPTDVHPSPDRKSIYCRKNTFQIWLI